MRAELLAATGAASLGAGTVRRIVVQGLLPAAGWAVALPLASVLCWSPKQCVSGGTEER